MTTCLSPNAMLELWERGTGRHPLDQALLVLEATDSSCSVEELVEWPLGRRDRRLIEIRRDIFGDCIPGYAECPSCRSGVEFELSCRQLIGPERAPESATQLVRQGERQWLLRAPNSRDLEQALSADDLISASRALSASCIRPIDDSEMGSGDVAESYERAFVDKLADLDPLAEILIDLACPSCGHTWQRLFDITTYLWAEIRTSSQRLLQDIDVLARTYGWTEGEILRLSNHRRKLYVQMALS